MNFSQSPCDGPIGYTDSTNHFNLRGDNCLTLSLDRYLNSVKIFHEAVSELAAKLEEINNAREEALKASEELRQELDATDRQMREISAALRQQISTEFAKKIA